MLSMRPVFDLLQRLLSARVSLFAIFLIPVLFNISAAFAAVDVGGSGTGDNFYDYVSTTAEKTNLLPNLFAYICYIMGAVLSGLSINEFRKVVDGSGGGGLTIKQPLAKLGFGALFIALPYATRVMQNTMSEEGESFGFLNMNAFNFTGDKGGDIFGLSGMLARGVFNMGIIAQLCAYLAFIIGIFLVVRGLQMTKAHIENPGNNPLPEGLKRLGVGGALLSLPFIVSVVYNTFGADAPGLSNTGWTSSTEAGQGLDGMMTHFIQDIANPAYKAIEIFCYIAGIVMVLFAMQRLVRSAQDGPRGPLTVGTITMFIVAGLLLSFPQLLYAINASIFAGGAGGEAATQVKLMSIASSDGNGMDQNAVNVFSAVLAFMAVIGFLSVVRGLFMLKALADGGQATLMQVVVHLVAGAMCINLGSVINAVQHSLGLSSAQFAVVFS